SLWPLLVLLIFLSLRRNQQIAPKTVYLFMSLFVPIILAFTLSDAIKPIYLSRYLILSLPALYVLVSWILSLYPARLANMLKIGLTAAMILMLSVEISSAATPVKEDYRAASDYVTAHASPEDVIVLSAPFTVYPFEYYYRGPDSIQTLPLWDRYATGPIPAFSETELTADVQTIKDSHQTLWLLLSYDQGYEQAIRMYFDTHYERTDNVNFSPGLNLYAYKLRYDQHPLSAVLRRLNTDNSSSTLSIR
ncbi:MAG: hypothetical protein KGI59_03380, partial [Patescibacteria group bacterium]|nr:hypothetical protein [Patescibacteria group bacterium]